MHRIKRVIGSALALLLLVQTTGCVTWRAVEQPVPTAIAQHPNHKLRLTLGNGRSIVVDSARSSGDTLVRYVGREPLLSPVARITRVSTRRTSAIGTVAAVLAIPAIYVGVLALSFRNFHLQFPEGFHFP